jgi:hypothetical protein
MTAPVAAPALRIGRVSSLSGPVNHVRFDKWSISMFDCIMARA